MNCPNCGSRSKVKDSRQRKDTRRRIRECRKCGVLFETFDPCAEKVNRIITSTYRRIPKHSTSSR